MGEGPHVRRRELRREFSPSPLRYLCIVVGVFFGIVSCCSPSFWARDKRPNILYIHLPIYRKHTTGGLEDARATQQGTVGRR